MCEGSDKSVWAHQVQKSQFLAKFHCETDGEQTESPSSEGDPTHSETEKKGNQQRKVIADIFYGWTDMLTPQFIYTYLYNADIR